jgi:uncharacterized membrane protein
MAEKEDPKKKALETASIIEDALQSIAAQVSNIFSDAMSGTDKVTQTVTKDIQKRFNDMAKVTDDIASNAVKLKEGLLKTKEVEDQIIKRKIKQEALGTQLLTHLRQQGKEAGSIEELIQKQNDGSIKLTKNQKALVQEFLKSKEYNEDYIKQLEEQKSLAISQTVSFKKLGDSLQGLTSKFTLSFALTGILSMLKEMDSQIGDYAKSMNLSYSEAVNVKKEMNGIALASGEAVLTSARLMETQAAIGAQLGTNAKLNEADLKTFTKLREQAGFTNEELMGIQQLSLVNGKSLSQNTKEILGGAKAYASRNKLVVNEKQILKDISKASASLKLSLGGSADALARSAVQARKFGLSLEQTEKMSQSLLNFEDSIESELSAELLTGKNLNLERARGLALNGDTAAAAAEIAAQVGTSADFARMNVIQQEAIAKAAGLTKDELAQSLIDRESLSKLGAKEGQDAQSRYNEMRAAGMSQSEIAKKLGDEELAKQYEQQSVQERFNDTMLQLKETLMSGILPAFEKMGKFLTDNMGMVKTIVGLFIALKSAQMAYNALSLVSLAISKKSTKEEQKDATFSIFGGAFKSLGSIPVVGAILAGALVAATLASMFSNVGKAEDGVISPQGGLLVSGQKGSIQLNKDDSIIAGTNLGGGKKQSSGGGGGDMSSVVGAIAELRRDINALANRPINVSMDGKKVIEATTGAQPNTTGDESRKNSYRIS